MAEPLHKIEPLATRIKNRVLEIAARCLKESQVPSDAITDHDLAALADDELLFMARDGLIHRVNRDLAGMRKEPVPSDSAGESAGVRRNPMHPIQGRNPTFWRGLSIRIQGADGSLKELLRFNVADSYLLTESGAEMRVAGANREKLGRKMARLLKQSGCETIADLPAEVLAELDEEAAKVWGRV